MFSRPSHILQEEACFQAFTPPISVNKPEHYAHGIIFASPHSGRIYPPGFTRRSRLPLATLRRNEDALMDEIIAPLPAAGFPTLQAHFPRCYVDVNRAPDELLPEWDLETSSESANDPETANDKEATARAKAGLGVIPTMISQNLPIYKTPLAAEHINARLETLYNPYHAALAELIEQAKSRAGLALVIDCHSMPSAGVGGGERRDIVLGDRFGTSAYPELVNLTEKVFKRAGYSVTRNYPYAGGYVTSQYGEPERGCHVIQIEVNRRLYVNPTSFKRAQGFDKLQNCFLDLANSLFPYMAQSLPRAAE